MASFVRPLVARAQSQPKVARLGYLGFGSPAASAAAFVGTTRRARTWRWAIEARANSGRMKRLRCLDSEGALQYVIDGGTIPTI